jgi:putative membrane protein
MLAVVLAFLNAVVKPILTVLTIPITIFSLGLFLLVINAGIILMAQKLVNGFRVDGFLTALIFSVILSLSTGILNAVFGLNEKSSE